MSEALTFDWKQWSQRIALALLAAVLIGLAVYLLARGITSLYLLYQQRQWFSATTEAVRGGSIMALADGNLRALRKQTEALAADYAALSAQIGFVGGGIAGALAYVWLERRAARS